MESFRSTAATAAAEAPAKRGPGRPRKNPLPEAATAAAEAPAAAAEAPVKRGPGRPRKSPLAATPVAPVARAKAGPSQSAQLTEKLDKWMQENPGPKTIAELAQAAVDGQWLDKGDVRRVVETTVPRLRETFVRAPDGTFQRRADLEQAIPGKLVRRRRGETVPA